MGAPQILAAYAAEILSIPLLPHCIDRDTVANLCTPELWTQLIKAYDDTRCVCVCVHAHLAAYALLDWRVAHSAHTHRPMLPPPYGSDEGAVGWPSELWVLANVISFSNLSALPTETVTTVLNTMARCLDVRTCVHMLAYIGG